MDVMVRKSRNLGDEHVGSRVRIRRLMPYASSISLVFEIGQADEAGAACRPPRSTWSKLSCNARKSKAQAHERTNVCNA